MPLTYALGQFVADLSPNRLPEEAMRIARLGFIDCIGTMIVGRSGPMVFVVVSDMYTTDGNVPLVNMTTTTILR